MANVLSFLIQLNFSFYPSWPGLGGTGRTRYSCHEVPCWDQPQLQTNTLLYFCYIAIKFKLNYR